MPDKRTRVALIFGGRSGEHDVSCYSAAGMLSHLHPDKYEVIPVWITPEGRWVIGSDRPRTGRVDVPMLLSMTPAEPAAAGAPERSPLDSILDALPVLRTADVVLPALHGQYGEDGTLQSLLASAGIPYVGNRVLTSATGMDKDHTKKLMLAAGLEVAPWAVLRNGRDTLSQAERDRLGLPVFVKPAHGGSSLGVSRVDSWDRLPAAVAVAREAEDKVIVEAAVAGREVDLGVLEFPDGRVEAGPSLEIRVDADHTFFDYEAKYSGHGSTFDIPAKLPPELTATLAEQAVRIFRALGCEGLCRVDFFLRDGVHPVANEINTLPGLTPASQFPQMWQAAGVTYPELLDILIQTAIARATRRHGSATTATTADAGADPAALPGANGPAELPAGTLL
ncbi:MAG TPA: D-alanine--D-alanine ligase family protein [Micromonosporaceae bacterium]|nr:D-alanine--D-alanine ligase family protein [Micromonosporaceae bacterium]